jgi:O-antigen ligase
VTVRRVAFASVLVLIFTIPMENIVEIPGFGRISKAVGFGVMAVWAVSLATTGRIRRPRPLHLAVLMFAAWNLLSVMWSIDAATSLQQSLTFVQLAVLVYLLWDTLRTHAQLCAAMQAYVLGAWVTVGSLLIDFLGGSDYQARFTTGSFEVNSLALVLGLGIPFAWYVAVGPDRSRARLLVVVDLLYIPAAVVAVLLTGSRSALVSLLPGLVYVLVWLLRLGASRRLVAVCVLTAAGLFIASQSLVPERTFERLSTTGAAVAGGDFGGRLDTWRLAYDTFADHPVTGIGSGAFRTFGGEKAAHNVGLRFLVEVGVVGFALFAAIVILAVVDSRRQRRALVGMWIALLMMWGIGAAVHNFEDRKQTWLVFSLATVGAGTSVQRAARSVAFGARSGAMSVAGRPVWDV